MWKSVSKNLGNRSGLKRSLDPGLSTWPFVIVSNVSWFTPPAPRRQSRRTCTHQSWVVSKVVGHALSDSGPLGMWFWAPEVELAIVSQYDTVLYLEKSGTWPLLRSCVIDVELKWSKSVIPEPPTYQSPASRPDFEVLRGTGVEKSSDHWVICANEDQQNNRVGIFFSIGLF